MKKYLMKNHPTKDSLLKSLNEKTVEKFPIESLPQKIMQIFLSKNMLPSSSKQRKNKEESLRS
jgi:hypothetical protein